MLGQQRHEGFVRQEAPEQTINKIACLSLHTHWTVAFDVRAITPATLKELPPA
jgi:hypothetical protein